MFFFKGMNNMTLNTGSSRRLSSATAAENSSRRWLLLLKKLKLLAQNAMITSARKSRVLALLIPTTLANSMRIGLHLLRPNHQGSALQTVHPIIKEAPNLREALILLEECSMLSSANKDKRRKIYPANSLEIKSRAIKI